MVAQLEIIRGEAVDGRPVVVIGSGPVGVRFALELHRRNPSARAVLYGAEPQEPYNRVKLSSLLAGELRWDAFSTESVLPPEDSVARRFGCAITRIDRDARMVCDARGRLQPYSQLIIATGSTPHVPNVPGVELAGVYTFRDFHDAQRLFARRVRSRRTVVLGAGLLGLEAARAMRRFNTEVIVIDHAPRAMHRQLDDTAAEILRAHLARLGVQMILSDSARTIVGNARVAAVQLMSGTIVECDTVVVAAGIRPNIDLARRAGLSVGRGIRVDDEMRTSDPNVFAIGECAEHRGVVYGLAAPGLEQAAVAASVLCARSARYAGSIAATRLKVVGLPVFSMGRVSDDDLARDARHWSYRSEDRYCKLLTEKQRIVGAVAIGEVPQLGRLQEAISRGRRVWPWQLWAFRRRGRLWPERQQISVCAWPANVTVCNCTGVTRGKLGAALAQGCSTPAALAAATGASTVCGSCLPLLTQLCGGNERTQPIRGAHFVLIASVLAALASLSLAVDWDVHYSGTVQAVRSWDFLWRTAAWKQISGYSVLGLSAIALLLSLRKRIKRFSLGQFAAWRIVHVSVGVLTLGGLLVHTGGRLGSNLNLLLMLAFLSLALLGAASGVLFATEHKPARPPATLKRRSLWAHILLFWPVPALLTMHVLKSYFF